MQGFKDKVANTKNKTITGSNAMSDNNNMFTDESHKFVDRQSIEGYMSDGADGVFSHHKFNHESLVKKSNDFNDINAEV